MRRPASLLCVPLLLLAGCAQAGSGDDATRGGATEAPVVLGTHRGMPPGMRAGAKPGRPSVAILGSGRLALTTWGSSTCPEVPVHTSVRPTGTVRLVVRVDAKPHQECTADLGPSTTRLGVDRAITAEGSVPVQMVVPGERKILRMSARPVERR